MKKLILKVLVLFVAISQSLFGQPSDGKAEKKTESNKKESLMERMDFGNSYILGQSIKSGSTYLLHRKKSDIKSMLKCREDYRKEILEDFKVKGDS